MTSQHTIRSTSGDYARKVWLLEPETRQPERIAIFFDGEFYVGRIDVPDVIHDLQQKGTIPSTAFLFVSHVDGEHRHRELTCNRDFADFVAGDAGGLDAPDVSRGSAPGVVDRRTEHRRLAGRIRRIDVSAVVQPMLEPRVPFGGKMSGSRIIWMSYLPVHRASG